MHQGILVKIHRKKTIGKLFNKIKKKFPLIHNPNIKTRMYLDQCLVNEYEYEQTLEDYFLERGIIGTYIYIEAILPTGIWPRETGKKRKWVGLKQVTSGLYNLGNSNSKDVFSLLYECVSSMLGKH